jgi:hypothetical protein
MAMTIAMPKVLAVAASIGAALWMPLALAADPAGARPGDDALTCEQIYAQGAAESGREQDERNRRNDERGAQGRATAALITSAALTGGMGGTGQAAQKAAEAQADGTVALLGAAPQVNARKEHLRQLWTQKHCVKK